MKPRTRILLFVFFVFATLIGILLSVILPFEYVNLNRKIHSVPLIMHQIYGLWEDEPPPEDFQENTRLWKEQGWSVKHWNKQDVLLLMIEKFPELQDIFRMCQRKVMQADLARYMIIYEHGGLYMDMDCKPDCKPLGSVGQLSSSVGQLKRRNLHDFMKHMKQDHLFFVENRITNHMARFQGQYHEIRQGQQEIEERIANFAMACVSRHPLMKDILTLTKERCEQFPERQGDYDVIYKTGPDCVSQVIANAISKDKNLFVHREPHNLFMEHKASGSWRRDRDKLD